MEEVEERRFTKNIHMDYNGEYTEERAVFHRNIMIHYISRWHQSNNNKKAKREAIILGGGSNSGKSFARDDFMDGHLLIDPDEIKKVIPEYEIYQNQYGEKAASYVHDESSDIADKILKNCIRMGIPFLYDGTMKNTAKYKGIIHALHGEKYTIHMIVVDVPVKIAHERNQLRYEETNRLVPTDILEESHRLIPKSFKELKILVHNYLLFDTRSNYPELIAKKTTDEHGRSQEIIINKKLYREFLKKQA